MLVNAQIPGAGRIWECNSLPDAATYTISFNANDFMHDKLTKATYKRVGKVWEKSTIYLEDAKISKDTVVVLKSQIDTVFLVANGSNLQYQSTRFVGSNNELKKALADAENYGYPSEINFANNFTTTDSFALPKRPMMLTIDGKNAAITINSPSGTFLYRDAVDMSESENIIDFAPFFHNLNLYGKSGRGNAIRVSSCYVGEIYDSHFYGFKDAIVGPRAMGLNIHDNRFWNGTGWYVTLTYKGIPGGSSSGSQPNMSSVHDNCFRVDSGALGAVLIEGGSLIPITHNAIEGGTKNHNGSDYGILNDYCGSPNVKSADIEINHLEVKFKIAAVKVILNDGFIHYTKNYRQYGGTELLIDNDNGYPQVNYHYQDYIVNNAQAGFTTWKGSGATWDFIGVAFPVKETNASMWSDGLIPYYRQSKGFGEGADKYPYIRSNPALQIK